MKAKAARTGDQVRSSAREEKPAKEKPVETRPLEAKPAAIDANAPFISFDHVPAMGISDGMLNIVLSASRPTLMSDGSVPNVAVVVAQLRCNLEGLSRLRASIDKLLLLSSETQGPPS